MSGQTVIKPAHFRSFSETHGGCMSRSSCTTSQLMIEDTRYSIHYTTSLTFETAKKLQQQQETAVRMAVYTQDDKMQQNEGKWQIFSCLLCYIKQHVSKFLLIQWPK